MSHNYPSDSPVQILDTRIKDQMSISGFQDRTVEGRRVNKRRQIRGIFLEAQLGFPLLTAHFC